MQFRYNGGIVLMLLVGVTLTWFVGSTTCVNYALTWFGNPPVTFTIVCLQVLPPRTLLPPALTLH